jgi:hypothetical protein
MTIVANPRNYKIPDWFLNRQRDYKTGRMLHVSAQNEDKLGFFMVARGGVFQQGFCPPGQQALCCACSWAGAADQGTETHSFWPAPSCCAGTMPGQLCSE